jgi:hypothetical protein
MRLPILLGGLAAGLVFLVGHQPAWAVVAFGTACAAATFVPPPGLDPERFFSPEDRRTIFDRAGGRCEKCGKATHFESDFPAPHDCPVDYQADHKYPHARGGRTVLSNGACLCRQCNGRKGARIL